MYFYDQKLLSKIRLQRETGQPPGMAITVKGNNSFLPDAKHTICVSHGFEPRHSNFESGLLKQQMFYEMGVPLK